MRRLAPLLALLLLACPRETPQPPAPAPRKTVTAPQDGGRLVRRIENDIETLNYVLHTGEEERQVLTYLYDPLIALDQSLNPAPGIATKWEITEGNRVYTLHLDPRATFSDGVPVKASDVIFTLHKMIDVSLQFGSWFETLDRAQTKPLDDHTVRVVFKEPRVTQLLSFNIGIMPEHVYGKGDFGKITAVVGNGPYVLKKRERGTILLERRADYWREKPRIASVLFRFVADDAVAWNAIKRGQIDVGRIHNETWFRDKDNPAVKEKIEFQNVWPLSYNFFIWNLKNPLFADVRVRRALAMNYDRRTVIDTLYHGQARPVTGPFVPDQWAYNHEVLPIEFNPQAAAAVLASAGWSDANGDGTLEREGKPFRFDLLIPSENAAIRSQAQVYQDALRRAGITMNIREMDGAAYFDRVLQGNFESAFFSWYLDPDPDPFSIFHSSQVPPNGLNAGSYVSAEADQLIEQGRAEFDHARRAEIYHHLHDLIARDQPYLFTLQPAFKFPVNRRVQNVHVAPGLGLFLWHPGPFAWWLKQ
ncbi:MAG TPA: ABC transporter substrate-binding protein [Thermoanaerobaculia bacterium]|nr:ABC transporter substrate-binding protein [Thermoanaerobaculia bacterium]